MSKSLKAKINCPNCQSNRNTVREMRHPKTKNINRRRRICLNCEKRFSTVERICLRDIYGGGFRDRKSQKIDIS